jgi:hypothetical protein
VRSGAFVGHEGFLKLLQMGEKKRRPDISVTALVGGRMMMTVMIVPLLLVLKHERTSAIVSL